MVIYEVIREERQHLDIGSYIAYGIQAVDSRAGEVLSVMRDVFLRPADAEELVGRCNAGGLDPIHLPDVVEDALI